MLNYDLLGEPVTEKQELKDSRGEFIYNSQVYSNQAFPSILTNRARGLARRLGFAIYADSSEVLHDYIDKKNPKRLQRLCIDTTNGNTVEVFKQEVMELVAKKNHPQNLHICNTSHDVIGIISLVTTSAFMPAAFGFIINGDKAEVFACVYNLNDSTLPEVTIRNSSTLLPNPSQQSPTPLQP